MPRASSGAPHSDSSRRPCDSLWFLFALFTAGAVGFKFSRPSAKGRGGACTVLELARSAASGVGAGRHPPCPAGAAHGAAGGNFSRWQRSRPIWGSERGPGSKYGGFVTGLLLRDLVERSILVYGKWGQFGHLEGARGGHVVCLNPLIWRLLVVASAAAPRILGGQTSSAHRKI